MHPFAFFYFGGHGEATHDSIRRVHESNKDLYIAAVAMVAAIVKFRPALPS